MLEMEIVEPEILEMEIEGQMPSRIGGTTNYKELSNKPQINEIELIGNKTLDELNIAPKDETNSKIGEVESIAKGANQALSFGDYATMISVLNSLNNDIYIVGQNILVVTLNVPDLWVSNIAEESVAYAYTTDEDFTNQLKENGIVQVGYYKLSALETQKVDLTDYIKNTDYATSSKGGVVKISSGYGLGIDSNGVVALTPASESDIEEKTNTYKPVTPKTIDYAVKKGLTDNQAEWSDEEKQSAKDLLGITDSVESGVELFNEEKNAVYTFTTSDLETLGLTINKWYVAKKDFYVGRNDTKSLIYAGTLFKITQSGSTWWYVASIYANSAGITFRDYNTYSNNGTAGFSANLRNPSVYLSNRDETYLLHKYVDTNRTKSYSALTTDNTNEYTPTKDYHPSTKKYVDDSVATALGNIENLLGGI